ncbi:MAG: hypothetical protein LBD22_01365 [Spirochaetaceae bacterium]|jgi:hypothetical protein|nr:hypothetical protein [Spirochaetaceae bacterium]
MKLLALCLLLTGCSFREPSAISFYDAKGSLVTINALSKRAQSGTITLDRERNYRYEIEYPVSVPPDMSLALTYTLKGLPQHDGSSEPVIEFGTNTSYALPVDTSFFDVKAAARLCYVMPVDAPVLHTLVITTPGGAPPDTALQLESMQLVPRHLGYERRDDLLIVTPYVHGGQSPSGTRMVSITPPETEKGRRWQFKLKGIRGGAFFESGKRRYEILAAQDAHNLNIPPWFFGTGEVVFEGESDAVQLVPVEDIPFPEPRAADPNFILNMPRAAWRDQRYEIFRWDMFPSILIFDMSDHAFQDKMMRRLAQYTEKKGYRGQLVCDVDLEGKHGWSANDYRAETLANFYNLAARKQFPLSSEERELEQILVAERIILKNAATGEYEPGQGAILSISRQSNQYLRTRFIVHECFHGLFFIDSEFRAFSEKRYAQFNATAKAFLRSYLDYLSYDISDPYLLINEFMSYIVQQTPGQAADYFGKYAAEIIEESDWRKPVLPPKDEATGTWPLLAKAFEREAEAFSSYAAQRWGFAAGRVWRIRPLQNTAD